MEIIVFLLLMAICLGLVYLVHKYFGKEEFYLLGVIYSIAAFILSFKIINILGVNLNANLLFTSGIILILYYFVNRYSEKETKKFIFTIIISSLSCLTFLMLSAFMVPSIYDKMSIFYQNLVLDNLPIVILYPISLAITLFLSGYSFTELKKESSHRLIKTIFTIIGITFIDIAIFIYFSYAFLIKFDIAIKIAIDNYLAKAIIMVTYILTISKVFQVKKVK